MEKKKIIIGVDNRGEQIRSGWCWSTQARSLAHHLPEYDFEIIPQVEVKRTLKQDGCAGFDCDLFFWRGYSNVFMDEEDLQNFNAPFVCSLATGGVNLKYRLEEMESTAKQASALMVQNQEALYQARLAGYDNIHLIPNGVLTNIFKPVKPPKDPIVGCAGNTTGDRGELKGTNFIQQACNDIGFEYREANLDKIRSHEEMTEWYQSLKYYIQPSEAEGCSNSVAEAMSCGIPVLICRNVGYHGEVCRCGITERDSGEVVFVERSAESIATALLTLEYNPIIDAGIRKNARRFSELHEWRHIAPKFRLMFETALANKANLGMKSEGELAQILLSVEQYSEYMALKEKYAKDSK